MRMPSTRRPDPLDPFDLAPMSDSLRSLARQGVLRQLRKGAQLITEGDRGDSLYILLAGEFRAYGASADGREVTYALYGPGDYVGELGLDGGLRSANVETTRTSLCALVTRPTLESHLASDPRFAWELLEKVIRSARAATAALRQIALNSVSGRLKDLLEAHAKPQPDGTRLWDPAPSQRDIALLLSCSHPMVNRVLADWQAGGYVQAERLRIRLLKVLPVAW